MKQITVAPRFKSVRGELVVSATWKLTVIEDDKMQNFILDKHDIQALEDLVSNLRARRDMLLRKYPPQLS